VSKDNNEMALPKQRFDRILDLTMTSLPSLPPIHQIRRQAPLHYSSRAENAYFNAYVCASVDYGDLAELTRKIDYCGGPSTAIREAFGREASLALELIIKAVIAQRIESGRSMKHVIRVRPTHDLDTLWIEAQLPTLPPADQHRLLMAKRILRWSGRYAAPNEDRQYVEEEQAMAPLEGRQTFGKLLGARGRSFNWEDFDRIYQVANIVFVEVRHGLTR
jgi:hypothetical protein